VKYDGTPLGDPWPDIDWDTDPNWDFSTAAVDSPETLYAYWDGAVERSRRRLAAALAKDGGLDQEVAVSRNGEHANLRRLLSDLVEEYGRHTGHADLLREAVDGVTGEDPPAGWRPKSGSTASPVFLSDGRSPVAVSSGVAWNAAFDHATKTNMSGQ
jgi:Protein of unknown function (DUF664)